MSKRKDSTLDSSKHNYAFWQTEARAKKFKVMYGLQRPEEVIFKTLGMQYFHPAILDLGVGAGRTTTGLLKVGADYTGLDYSEIMVNVCKDRYPGVKFVLGDARDLAQFGAGSFDIVVFSYNGIDCVGPSDREAVLASVRRVLKPGGTFVHSSHNLNFEEIGALKNPFLLSRLFGPMSPKQFVRRVYLYLTGIVASMRLRKQQIFGPGWAVLNEQTNRFRELMYYITPETQVKQLVNAGFRVESMYGLDGEIRANDSAARVDAWVYYVSKPFDK